MNKIKLLSCTVATVLALSSLASSAATRDLVFEDEEDAVPAADTQTLSLKTTVLLTRDGQETTVLPTEEFKSGDRVKLLFTSNVDGYVYWLAQGSSGAYSMLFPNDQTGMDNSIVRNQQYTIPTKGSFRFDDTPGDETLLCIMSTERMPDLDAAAGLNFEDSSSVEQTKKKSSTRDLVFEDEEDTDVSTVAQTAPVGEPIVVQYVLKHN